MNRPICSLEVELRNSRYMNDQVCHPLAIGRPAHGYSAVRMCRGDFAKHVDAVVRHGFACLNPVLVTIPADHINSAVRRARGKRRNLRGGNRHFGFFRYGRPAVKSYAYVIAVFYRPVAVGARTARPVAAPLLRVRTERTSGDGNNRQEKE